MEISPSKEAPTRPNNLLPPKRMEWPESTTTIKVKLGTESGVSDYFYTIDGTEEAELFLLWLQDFRSKALNNQRVSPSDTRDVLIRILRGEAKAVVERTIANTKGEVTVLPPPSDQETRVRTRGAPAPEEPVVHTTLFDFTNHLIRRRLAALQPAQWETYWKSEQHDRDIINECIHRLKLLVYGSDMKGKKTYTRLRRVMSNFRINFNNGIRKWAQRMDDYQSYLPDMLWEAGEKRGETMRKFNETELRELLDGCLNMSYNTKLINLDWDVQEHPYRESLAKLESVEPEIIQLFQQQKRLDALEAKNGNKGSKGNNSNKRKRGDDNNSHNTNSGDWNSKRQKGNGKPTPKGNKKPWDNNFRKELVNLITEVTQKDDSDLDESLKGWRKNTTKAERLYVLGAAQTEASDYESDFSVDTKTAKKYLKRLRNQSKHRKSSNKK